MKRLLVLAIVAATLFLVLGRANAGPAKLEFVEVEARIFEDGKASVLYTVRYRVTGGELHGFYFQGWGRAAA